MTMASDIEVMDRGISCLINGLGTVDTERFVSLLVRERFDYTEWQRRRFDDVGEKELFEAAVEYNEERPFHTS